MLRVTKGTTCQKAHAIILLKLHFDALNLFVIAGSISGGSEEPEQGGEGGGRGGGGEQDEGGGGPHQVPCFKTLRRIPPPRPDGAGLVGQGRGK